ncbi:MAG: beta-ketoacyl synthase chain length factor [Niabella sp.]
MYIHQHICISPQKTTGITDWDHLQLSEAGKLMAIEPVLEGVPPGMLRRMSKAVRMGIGTGLPLIKSKEVSGIIIGTANGGMEDCIKFLNQIVDYDEGMLTPGNFVQSTPNAIAGQLSLLTKNHHYNATHVHNGLAFENALLDALMFINDHAAANLLVGAVDEISSYNYNIDLLAGWYDKAKTNTTLYQSAAPGTIAGEGAAMFLVNGIAEEAVAKIEAVTVFQTTDTDKVRERFSGFLQKYLPDRDNMTLITGENGDARHLPFYESCEAITGKGVPVVRFKHLTGEYPTAVSFALWLACQALQNQALSHSLYKTNVTPGKMEHIIIYNQYQGKQHSFIFVSKNF